MKLYVLDLGKIVMRGDNPVVDTAQANAEAPAIPIHAFLADTPVGKILFDTGCHPKAMEGAWPPEMCTNPYVAGSEAGLLARLFPQAKVYVQQWELERVLHDADAGTLDVFHLPCDVENWKAAGIQWEPVPDSVREVELCPGVTVLNLGPGHSYGMLGMYVETQESRFLLASDAVYSREYYGPPAKLSGAVCDEPGYFAAIEYIRDYAAQHDALVLFGHDMEQFQSLRKSGEGAYQ